MNYEKYISEKQQRYHPLPSVDTSPWSISNFLPFSEIHEIPYINPVFDEIHQHLIEGSADDPFLSKVSRYYFDGLGKSVRPKLTESMAEAVNCHLGLENDHRYN